MPSWRPESSRCECSLTIQPPTPEFKPSVTPAELVASEEFIRSILYYAHQLESFQRAHSNFEELKEYWTPQVFGKMVNIIDMAGCTRLDGALRDFHQSIRNNGLWKVRKSQNHNFAIQLTPRGTLVKPGLDEGRSNR